MEKAKITPKDFFLWVGAIVSLYWSAVAFVFLMFDYINYAFPNTLSNYPSDPYESSIPYDMASIIVLFPLYLVLAWVIRRSIHQDATRADIWVRRWALIGTLFIAGVTAAGDLIILLTTFLRGEEITAAFAMKVLVVLLIAAAAFMHFTADLWGYWTKFPSRRNSVFIAVVCLVIFSLVSGFFIVGSPRQARLKRFDDQKIQDLQNVQSQIVSYYQQHQLLPVTLSSMDDSISGFFVPLDPQSNTSYEYQVATPVSFSLCATFNDNSSYDKRSATYPMYPESYGVMGGSNWQHAKGRVCFDRTIDPKKYAPVTPQTQKPI